MPEAKPETAAQPKQTYENDESAGKALEAYLQDEPPKPETDAPKAEEAAEEAQPEQEAQPEAEEEARIEIDPEAKIFDVEEVIEGGAKEVRKYSINELKAQRMMQADYQRKTAELARQRDKVAEETRQVVEAERKRFLASAQGMQKALYTVVAQEFQQEGVDLTNPISLQAFMGRLAKDDPARYVQMSNRLNEINSTVNLVSQTIESETAQYRQKRVHEIATQAREAWEALSKDVKGWNDETYSSLLKVGYEYGFKPEEIANPVRADGSVPEGYIPAVDHRFIRLLQDAYAYRQQQKQQPIAEKKVAAAPKVIKPGAPAKADNKQRQDERLGRLKKSGRIDDAAAMLEGMMR